MYVLTPQQKYKHSRAPAVRHTHTHTHKHSHATAAISVFIFVYYCNYYCRVSYITYNIMQGRLIVRRRPAEIRIFSTAAAFQSVFFVAYCRYYADQIY
jgi:hypothetical protein